MGFREEDVSTGSGKWRAEHARGAGHHAASVGHSRWRPAPQLTPPDQGARGGWPGLSASLLTLGSRVIWALPLGDRELGLREGMWLAQRRTAEQRLWHSATLLSEGAHPLPAGPGLHLVARPNSTPGTSAPPLPAQPGTRGKQGLVSRGRSRGFPAGVQGVTSAPAGVAELSSVPDGACSGPARSPEGRWEKARVNGWVPGRLAEDHHRASRVLLPAAPPSPPLLPLSLLHAAHTGSRLTPGTPATRLAWEASHMLFLGPSQLTSSSPRSWAPCCGAGAAQTCHSPAPLPVPTLLSSTFPMTFYCISTQCPYCLSPPPAPTLPGPAPGTGDRGTNPSPLEPGRVGAP